MGMFDYLRCEFKLPGVRPEVQGLQFQTKCLDEAMDNFLLKEDGTLWHEEYDARVEETSEAFFGFYIHRENLRWVRYLHSGELRFYHYAEEADQVEFLGFMIDGQLRELHRMVATPQWVESGPTEVVVTARQNPVVRVLDDAK